MTQLIRIVVLILFSGLLNFAAPAHALGDHPLHATHAIVEFNAETSSFEVSLCVFPDDLSLALSAHAGRKIMVESAEGIDEIMKAYVDDKFQLRLDDSPPSRMQWLGHEFETQQVWLYFEFPIESESPADLLVKNSILMDQFDDQLNVAYVRIGGRQRCISFRSDTATWQPWKMTREHAAPAVSNSPETSD